MTVGRMIRRQAAEELLTAAARAEPVRLAVALRADRPLALDRHPADGIDGHRDDVLERAVLEPQDPVGDVAALIDVGCRWPRCLTFQLQEGLPSGFADR